MTNKEKYKKAFHVLASSEIISLEAENMMNKKHRKSFMAVTTVAAIAFGALTVCAAAYINWNNGLTEELQISEEQQKNLEDTGMAVFSEASCTEAGVTISAQQSIMDNYYTYLSFKIEGYDWQEGTEPAFENIDITVGGQNEISWGGSFYDGLIPGPDGRAVYADGTPIDYDMPIEGHYLREDGSLEYHIVLANTYKKGYFTGQPIHVEFENLGTVNKAMCEPDILGKWDLDWTLGGADTSKIYKIDEALGDTDAIVKEIEFSPVSFRITYEFPRKEMTEEVLLEDGATRTYTSYEEAPWPNGVKMKDGSLVFLYGGPGNYGYVDDMSDTYVIGYAFDRVINIDEVEGILFIKEQLNEAEMVNATEDDFYLLALK